MHITRCPSHTRPFSLFLSLSLSLSLLRFIRKLALYVLVIPFVVLYLSKRKHRTDDKDELSRYGYLFEMYRPERYWWVFVEYRYGKCVQRVRSVVCPSRKGEFFRSCVCVTICPRVKP